MNPELRMDPRDWGFFMLCVLVILCGVGLWSVVRALVMGILWRDLE